MMEEQKISQNPKRPNGRRRKIPEWQNDKAAENHLDFLKTEILEDMMESHP